MRRIEEEFVQFIKHVLKTVDRDMQSRIVHNNIIDKH